MILANYISQNLSEKLTYVEFHSQHLRNNVQVRNQSRLQDNGNVGGVEKLNGVAAVLTAVPCRLDWKVDTESLQNIKQGLLACSQEFFWKMNELVENLTWKYITTPKIKTVANKFIKLGRFCL